MEEKNIIFTSAFKDIRREKWNHYALSNSQYVNWFLNLVQNINYPLIVYIEPQTLKVVLGGGSDFPDDFSFDAAGGGIIETKKKERGIKENVIFKDLDESMINHSETPFFFRDFYDSEKKIMESEEYKSRIPDYRKNLPEHIFFEYNLINHSKINFLNKTKKDFPDYSYYAWIDFGRMNDTIQNIPSDLDFELIQKHSDNSQRIIYHCVNNPPHPAHRHRHTEIEMLKSNWIYFLGSSFIVPSPLVEKFETLWKEKLLKWRDLGVSDDDQNLVLQIYFDHPDMFYKIKTDVWYGMYRTLKKHVVVNKQQHHSPPSPIKLPSS